MSDPGRIPGPELIDNCIQIRTAFTLPNGRVAYNVLHARKNAGQAVNSALADAIWGPLRTVYLAAGGLASVQAANVSHSGLDIRDLSTPGNFPLIPSGFTSMPATGGAVMLPPNVALVLTLRTASAGQAFRGRVYIPGLASTDDQAPGTASPATITAITAWGSGIQSAFNAAGLTWVIAQPARQAYTGHGGRAHPARGAGMATITAWLVRNAIFDSQRRRSGRS